MDIRQYSRPIFVTDWHKSRQAEPKDYDFSLCPEGKKNLHVSTYKNLGTCTNDWSTTTESQLDQYLLKGVYQGKTVPQAMLTAENLLSDDFNLRTLDSSDATSHVLPRHKPGHDQLVMDTTYTVDYFPPSNLCPELVVPQVRPEVRPDFRKRASQFTDTADYRRHGHHTFQDDSGIYAVLGERPYGPGLRTNPICP